MKDWHNSYASNNNQAMQRVEIRNQIIALHNLEENHKKSHRVSFCTVEKYGWKVTKLNITKPVLQ